MLQNALALWRKTRLRGDKGTTLYLRLFIFFVFFMIALVLAFLLILNIAGVFRGGDQNNSTWFKNELEHLTHDISTDFGNLSVQGVTLSESLSKSIEGYLKETHTTLSDLDGDPEGLETLLSQQMPELLAALRVNKCGGTFLILDASAMDESPAAHRAGLFLKRTEPNTVSAIGIKQHFLRGPATVGRQSGIGLLGQWQMEFTVDETDFFSVTVDTARDNPNLPLSRLYYWSPRRLLAGNSEAGVFLCVPLIASDGTVLGVCGFEVSAMLFKQSYSPDNLVYTRVFSLLAPCEEKELYIAQGLMAGNTYLNSALGGSTAAISHEDDLMARYQVAGQEDYAGLHQSMSLYPVDSPHRESEWKAAVIAPYGDLEAIAHKDVLRLQIGIGLLCLMSLLMAAFVSRRYISPVLKTLEGIKSGEDYTDLPKTQYQEINDLLEFLASQDEAASAALAEVEARASALAAGERGKGRPSAVEPEKYQRFLECMETLSPAERRVFDLYVQEYKAAEIGKLLHLSINTVKYHNGNIYSKLEVGSRKELLGYIRYMRHHQIKEEGENGGHTV